MYKISSNTSWVYDNDNALQNETWNVGKKNQTLSISKTNYNGKIIIITVAFVLGIVGNLAALCILYVERKTRYKNRKHTLMLRCLASNDLIALIGMLIQMHVDDKSCPKQISCIFYVVWRVLGLTSGSVALVMAIERWIALTHPFLYQKRVTYHALLKGILICWATAFFIGCMPFLGFGLYINYENSHCARYREASSSIDIAYAYVVFVFGLLLCAGISLTNLSVTKFLCKVGYSTNDMLSPDGRRISRTPSNSLKNRAMQIRVENLRTATPEEIAFARLMVALSLAFVLCWSPTLLSIPLAQLWPKSSWTKPFFMIADILLAIHFMLDPFIYVILHHYFPCLKITFEVIQRQCCFTSLIKRYSKSHVYVQEPL